MLDPKIIREQPELIKQNTQERGFDPHAVDIWLDLDTQRNQKQCELESLNHRRNEIAQLLKDPKRRTPELIEEGKKLKAKIEPLEAELDVLQRQWDHYIHQIPNLHRKGVPVGSSDKQNVILRKVGTPRQFDFEPKDHLTLMIERNLIDFETGAKVSGSQFYYLKNEAVLLDLALQKFGMDLLRRKGYELVMTPDLAKSRYYLGTGYAPRGDEAQTYEIDGEDLGLIATAEVTMAGYFADEVLDAKDLPKKYAAISHCYRKEAGAYGKYSKGLYRVHQFTKLEMFAYTTKEDSDKLHQELLAIEEEIAQALEFPYQVVEMCTSDLGAMAARKYDLEAWIPTKNDYGEITSTSNCTDFQARNLNIRYRDAQGKLEYAHMLNGTAIVMSRFPLVIIENNQQADGSITIPKALVPYVGLEKI
jgi:seryl-tRNA synthetase